MYKFFIAFLILVFLYSGLIKWMNFPIDPTLLSFGLLIVSLLFIDLKLVIQSYKAISGDAKLLILFGTLYLITFVYTLSTNYFWEKIMYLIIAIFSFFIPVFFLNNKEKLEKFTIVFKYLGRIGILVLVYLYFSSKWYLFTVKDETSRIPNYLSIGSFLAVYLLMNYKDKKLISMSFNFVGLILLFLLSGRGPFLGLLLVFLFFVLKGKNKVKGVFILVPVLFALYYVISNYLFDDNFLRSLNRFGRIFERNERYYQIVRTFEIIENNLFFGVGIGGFGVAESGADEFSHPHNLILEILSESGVFLTLVFLYFLFRIFIKNNLKYDGNHKILIMASMFLFIQAMKSGGIPDMRVTFFWFGLMTLTIKKELDASKSS